MNFKRIVAIINPISGYSRSRELPAALKARLEKEGCEVNLHFTYGPGCGGAFARNNGKLYDLVVVSGGDGTIREVAEGLVNSDVPFTIYPAGTENLFAKEMEIHPELDQVIQTIKWGRRVTMDMAKVNEKCFLSLSGVGFDAQVLLQLNKFRTGNITHFTYFWPIWRTFWEYDFPPMTVRADGETLCENGRGLVFISNFPRYAVGLRICRKAVYDDGLLDVCIYLCDHQLPLLGHAWRTVQQKHLEHPNVIYRQAKEITVAAATPVPYQVDGDPAGFLPAQYTVLPGAVQVILPPG